MAIALSSRAPGALPSNTEVNPKEHVKAISTRSGVQLPEIYVKRSVANKEMVHENFHLNNPSDPLEACIVHSQSTYADSSEVEMCARYLEANPPYIRRPHFEELGTSSTKHLPSVQQPPKIEFKQLPFHLRYAYLGKSSTLPVIIANSISELEEEKLLRVLREPRQQLGGLLLTSRVLALLYACIKSSWRIILNPVLTVRGG
ncbi:RNA-directed DNA polymerase [Abeliophyllum distichum]|uniref:RNA-directed DNA polymerase n=1 Tax=Abeliophyllum distichum TaxID=126358 RepID=A0ABD1SAW1_9LAMI